MKTLLIYIYGSPDSYLNNELGENLTKLGQKTYLVVFDRYKLPKIITMAITISVLK